jgi:hypothetical protein
MRTRLNAWVWQMLVSLDQLAATWIFGWSFVWLGGDRRCPSADETISSHVGKAARAGKPWGLFWAKIIDWLAFTLAGQRNHCLTHIEDDEGN